MEALMGILLAFAVPIGFALLWGLVSGLLALVWMTSCYFLGLGFEIDAEAFNVCAALGLISLFILIGML